MCHRALSTCLQISLSGAHDPEKKEIKVIFLVLREPGRARTHRDEQSAGPKAETSHSSWVPAYETHSSTMSLESNNLITVPCYDAVLMLPTTSSQSHGTGMGSAQLQHLSSKAHKDPLYQTAVPAQPYFCQHSPSFPIQTHTPCSTHILSAQDTTPSAAHGGIDPSRARLHLSPFVFINSGLADQPLIYHWQCRSPQGLFFVLLGGRAPV